VNGTIYLENRSAYYSCSYNRTGDTLVEFFAEQQSWPSFVRGGGSPYQVGSGSATQLPANTVSTERVRFPSGFHLDAVSRAASAGHDGALPARRAERSVPRCELRGRRAGQLQYRIVNPDGSALLDAISVGIPYRGQLWQSGDHVVEVINRSGSTVNFQVYFEIE
jgi:hypothetical protein